MRCQRQAIFEQGELQLPLLRQNPVQKYVQAVTGAEGASLSESDHFMR